MKFGSDFKRLQCTYGVATTLLLMVLCTLFTHITVDFGMNTYAFDDQQKGLKWMFGSKSDLVAYSRNATPVSGAREAHHAWKELNPLFQPTENLRTVEPKEMHNVTLLTEVVYVAPSPMEENINSLEDLNDHVDKVEAVPPSYVEYHEKNSDASLDRDLLHPVQAAPFSAKSEQKFNASSTTLDPNEDVVLETDVASKGLFHDACLLVVLGRRSQTDRRAVPYEELYRLFNAAKRPWKTLKDKNLLVGTDSPTILCKMVRDSLGPAATCSSFKIFQVEKNHCKLLIVGETKKYTPQPSLSLLRKSNLRWDSEEIVDLDDEDPARLPPLLPESQWRPTIVTAFSSNHVDVGLLLLRSLGRVAVQQNKYNVSVVIWTMNDFPIVARRALACVVAELRTLYNVPTETREFDFSAWPGWMRINRRLGYNGGRGEYAWKAVMIHTVLVERGFVYWADAGNRFLTVNGLILTLNQVRLKGFASRLSGGSVKKWCHVRQLEYFGANKPTIKRLPNCDASSIGFTLRSYTRLARPWYECSITRQCIAPDGTSRKNHRQDQSALTVLAALSGDRCAGVDSGIRKQMDSHPESYLVGVPATNCYEDPINIKWK